MRIPGTKTRTSVVEKAPTVIIPDPPPSAPAIAPAVLVESPPAAAPTQLDRIEALLKKCAHRLQVS